MIIYDINLLIDIAYKIRLNVQGNKHFKLLFFRIMPHDVKKRNLEFTLFST